MTSILKNEVLQMVAAIDDDNLLSILKQDINELKHQSKHDWADELSEEELKELQVAMDEDDTKENSVTQEEFDKIIAKWRSR
jgi:hypothetical protein